MHSAFEACRREVEGSTSFPLVGIAGEDTRLESGLGSPQPYP